MTSGKGNQRRERLTCAQRFVQRVALQLPPRRAPQDIFKKCTISRAEGGQLQAPVGRQLALRAYQSLYAHDLLLAPKQFLIPSIK